MSDATVFNPLLPGSPPSDAGLTKNSGGTPPPTAGKPPDAPPKDKNKKRKLKRLRPNQQKVRLPIQPYEVPGLNSTALSPVEPSEEAVLEAAATLGLSGETWDKAKLRATKEFGKYMYMGVNLPVTLTVTSLKMLEEMEFAVKQLREILAEPLSNKSITVFDRVSCANAAAACVKAHRDKSDQLLVLRKAMDLDKPQAKPKNLPPTVAVQLNLAGGNAPSSPPPASSPTIDAVEVAPEKPPEKR